jgi:hypothetical protein
MNDNTNNSYVRHLAHCLEDLRLNYCSSDTSGDANTEVLRAGGGHSAVTNIMFLL